MQRLLFVLPLRKRKQARKASRQPLLFGWLAAERLWPTRREPGTLITALTLSLSAVGRSPLLSPPSREETTASFSYASPCVIVVVSSRLLSVPSLFGNAFAAGFTLPLPVRLPSTLCLLPLCAHVACCQLSAPRVVVCPIPSLSIYFLDQLSYHLSPSRLRLPSQRVS